MWKKHFCEQISLQDIADHLGLGKNISAVFSKKNMGMSFLHYVNEVRVSQIYRDLIRTDLPFMNLWNETDLTIRSFLIVPLKKCSDARPLLYGEIKLVLSEKSPAESITTCNTLPDFFSILSVFSVHLLFVPLTLILSYGT